MTIYELLKNKYIHLVFIGFVLTKGIKYFVAYFIFGPQNWMKLDIDYASSILVYSNVIVICLLGYFYLKTNPFPIFGLDKHWLKGLKTAIICSLPMIIGFMFIQKTNWGISLVHLHRYTILAGFYEEFFYRGFLFGVLFFYARLGFIPSVLLPTFLFGIGHIYQAENFSQAIQIFTFTALANVGFAWFYYAWKNIWFLIFLHALMDLIWAYFGVDANVTGSLEINIFRFTTLGLAVYFSRKLISKENLSFKKVLWRNSIES